MAEYGQGDIHYHYVNIDLSSQLKTATLSVGIKFKNLRYSNNYSYSWEVAAYDADDNRISSKATLSIDITTKNYEDRQLTSTVTIGSTYAGKTISYIRYECTSSPVITSTLGAYTLNGYSDGTLTQTTWEYCYFSTNLTIDEETSVSGAKRTIEWECKSGKNNSITGYTFKISHYITNSQNKVEQIIDSETTIESTNKKYEFDTPKPNSDTYYTCTLFINSNYGDNTVSQSVGLDVTIMVLTAPKNLKITPLNSNKNKISDAAIQDTFYLGASGRPSYLLLSWESGSVVGVDTFTYTISIYKGTTLINSEITGINSNTTEYILTLSDFTDLSTSANQTYIVGIRTTSGNSSSEKATATIKTIAIPDTPNLTSPKQILNIANTIDVAWDAIIYQNAIITYKIAYIQGQYDSSKTVSDFISGWGKSTPLTTCTLDLSDFENGKYYTFYIYSMATTSNYGGSTTTQVANRITTHFTVYKLESVSAPTIVAIYDKNYYQYNTTTKAPYTEDEMTKAGLKLKWIYNNITIKWNQVAPVTSELPVSYSAYYSVDNGVYNNIDVSNLNIPETSDTTSLCSLSITPQSYTDIKSASTIQFKIFSLDKNGSNYSITDQIELLTVPSFNKNPTFSQSGDKGNITFTLSNNGGQDGYNFTTLLSCTQKNYESNYKSISSGFNKSTEDIGFTNDYTTYTHSFDIIPIAPVIEQETSDDTANVEDVSLQGQLGKAITDLYRNPQAGLQVIISRPHFPQCYIDYITTNYQFNYPGTITAAEFIDCNQNGKYNYDSNNDDENDMNIWNPTDMCYFKQSKAPVFVDYLKNSHNDYTNWTYSISGNQTTINFNNNKTSETVVGSNTLPSNITSNRTIEYTCKTNFTYSDEDQIVQSSSNTIDIIVHRWTNIDELIFKATQLTSKTFSGTLTIPTNEWCDYTNNSYINLKSLVYDVYVDDTKITSQSTSINLEELRNNSPQIVTIPSQSLQSEKTNYNVYIIVTATNTSNNSLSIRSNGISARLGTIDVAIRKNRLGVNVDDNFGGNDDETQGSITAFNYPNNNTTNPILELSADNTTSPAIRIENKDSATSVSYSSDITLGDNGLLHIDNLVVVLNFTMTIWSGGYLITLKSDYITPNSIIEIYPRSTITAAQYKAFAKAMIIPSEQGQGYCNLKILNHPTSDVTGIPIQVLIYGGQTKTYLSN